MHDDDILDDLFEGLQEIKDQEADPRVIVFNKEVDDSPFLSKSCKEFVKSMHFHTVDDPLFWYDNENIGYFHRLSFAQFNDDTDPNKFEQLKERLVFIEAYYLQARMHEFYRKKY